MENKNLSINLSITTSNRTCTSLLANTISTKFIWQPQSEQHLQILQVNFNKTFSSFYLWVSAQTIWESATSHR